MEQINPFPLGCLPWVFCRGDRKMTNTVALTDFNRDPRIGQEKD